MPYRIRNPKTGLFSRGGNTCIWTKKGKVWQEKHHLSNHLQQCRGAVNDYKRVGAVIEEVEVTIVNQIQLNDWLVGVDERREKRENTVKQRREDFQRHQELKQLKELKRKYESESV